MGVLNGQMHIADSWGSVFFSVEEYKRPKFEVVANPAGGAYRLNGPVTVTGQAKAYAGSSVDGAQVKYRVVRTTNYPYWFGWWGFWCPSSPDMEITNGTTVTNDTGGFSVTFKAIPDPAVAKSYSPTFTYSVSFDVTDMNGETRSGAGSVTVGYAALSLSVDVPRQVNKAGDTAFALTAANLSGVPEPTKGTVRVFRLKGPDQPLRKRLWEKPDLFTIDKKDFLKEFPSLPYADEDLVMNWPREKMVIEKNFDTKTERQIVLPELREWPQGAYLLEATAKDTFGQEVKEVRYFTLFSAREQSMPLPMCEWFAKIKDQGEPGEKAVFCIGSGEQSVPVLYEVEHKGTIVKKEWFTLSAGQRTVEIPIEEDYRGNFGVHFSYVKSGRAYRHDETVTVPWTNKELSFSFETFRDKLLPGQKEEWKIRIAGFKKDKVAADPGDDVHLGTMQFAAEQGIAMSGKTRGHLDEAGPGRIDLQLEMEGTANQSGCREDAAGIMRQLSEKRRAMRYSGCFHVDVVPAVGSDPFVGEDGDDVNPADRVDLAVDEVFVSFHVLFHDDVFAAGTAEILVKPFRPGVLFESADSTVAVAAVGLQDETAERWLLTGRKHLRRGADQAR